MLLKAVATRPVKRLNLSGNLLGLEGAKILATFMETSKTLTQLHLDSCCLGDQGLQIIMESKKEEVIFEHLSLSNNQLTSIQSLLVTASLKGLDLSKNSISDIQGLSEILSQATMLQRLDLSGVCLAEITIQPYLQRLDLSDT